MSWQLLVALVGTLFIVILLSVLAAVLEKRRDIKNKKKIHIYYVNKIKNLDYKIFEQEDNDYPNYIVVRSCERWKKHWLDKANVLDEELRKEVLSICLWHYDDAKTKLEARGWQILEGKENL